MARQNKSHAGILLFLLILLSVALWKLTPSAPQQKGPESTDPRRSANIAGDTDLAGLLRNGNGNDYLALSQRDRVRLGILIQDKLGKHEPYDYVEFLSTFYDRAQSENQTLLSRPISETAAVCAAALDQR